jgi:hypothetical protein
MTPAELTSAAGAVHTRSRPDLADRSALDVDERRNPWATSALMSGLRGSHAEIASRCPRVAMGRWQKAPLTGTPYYC